jgi:tRNA pseudouridine38-40 synthase
MTLWKLVLSYDGTNYSGWQIQPALPTVQATLAAAIKHVTGDTVLPQGSGRTDAGVHALGQVASFSLNVPIPSENLLRALNRALPPSIRALSLEAAEPGFHARHSAIRKTYEYRIFPGVTQRASGGKGICLPMLAPFVWDCPWPLDPHLLQAAADAVVGEHDFTSFAASDPDLATRKNAETTPSNTRRIDRSEWHMRNDIYIYTVTGTGFLHHMVRNLVGTFVNVGAKRLPIDSISGILAARNRSAAGPTAPARGLFLVEVEY